MTKEQISAIVRTVTVDLNCDNFHENAKEIVASWDEGARPPSFEKIDELRDKVVGFGGAIFVNVENTYGEYVVTIVKDDDATK